MADSVAASSQGDDSRPTTPIARESSRTQTYHFQWELASRRKGPGSVVSEATESRAGDGLPPRTDVFFENMDHGSATPSFPTSWSASTQGFNAISTVLNNPKTRPNPLKSSKAPQPPVNSPDLKRIRRKDFDPYLKAIGPAWQQFERNKSDASNSAASFGASLPLSPTSDTHNGIPSSNHSVLSDPASSDSGPRSTLPPLSGVPSIYFNPSFDLSDPRTFAAVTEQDTGATHRRTSSSPADIALNHILQEKLSHYMDIVEQHLVQEIAIRSVPFFAALSNLQDLQTEGAACLSRIARLKAQLQDVDNFQARRGLEVVRLQSKRNNIQQLQRAVKDIREVGETVGIARHLADEGDHFAALGLTETVQSLLERKERADPPTAMGTTVSQRALRHEPHGSDEVFSLPTVVESPNTPTAAFTQQDTNGAPLQDSQTPRLPPPSDILVDLSSLASLSDIPTKLIELRTSISLALQRDLLALLTEDLVAQTKGSEPGITATSSENLRSESWKAQLHVLLDGLLRTGGIERAFASYKEVALAQIRLLVQAHQANSKEQLNNTENDLDPTSGDNVEFVKDMDHKGFMRLMRSLYSTLLESVRTTQEHGILIQKTLQDIAEQKQSEHIDLSEDCSNVVFAVAELASSCCAKLLNARSEQNVGLAWPDFLGLYNETSSFNIECEILCRTMIIALRGAANSQAKAYLAAFHSQRISESAKLVEEETWSAVDVPPKYQRLVTVLIEAAVSNPPEILAQSSQPTAPSEEEVDNGPSPKHVVIEDQQFYVVGATLQAIRLIIDYLSIIANLPLLTIDVMPKIIEFLKAFNSRTCQVVLGAGALRSAGLKNITARHLALASQSLTVMITLIPYVRETFRRHLSPKQAVMLIEFDKLKRDFQEHQNEIYTKLISIMGDRLAVHCKSLQEIDWTAPNSKPPPNTYMEVLVKETATLHKVLNRYLSAHASELIMSQVFAAINHRLSEEYGKIDLPSQEAKDRLLEDARYLHGRLSALPGVGGLSSMLEIVVSDKRVVVPTPPEPVINMAASAPVVPAKPTRRTLSSIFGKDSKFASKAPPSSPTPILSEKQETLRPVTEKDTETSPKSTDIQKSDINVPDASFPSADENPHTESEHPKAAEEHSTAPTEAIQPGSISTAAEVPSDGNNAPLAGDTLRVTTSSPNTEQADASALRSQTTSPTQPDGDQSTSQ